MKQIGFEEADDHAVIMDQQGKLPFIVRSYMTKELDYHQKEHLFTCKLKPKDWKEKYLKFKSNLESKSKSSSKSGSTPDVISINLTWQQSQPCDVLTTLNMIPSMFSLSEFFEIDDELEDKSYYFKGMICYWGLHYFWFVRHITSDGEYWIEYNDKELFRIPSWRFMVEDLVSTCCK